jgi:hypothetical protein
VQFSGGPSVVIYGSDQPSPGARADSRPELADVGRLARRFVRRTVAAARAEEGSVARLLADHLRADGAELPVARTSWPAYDRVNVQTGLAAWLAEPEREHRLVGLTQYRHHDFALADLLHGGDRWGPATGSVETEALPAGPGGVTKPCVQCGVYLTEDAGGRAVLLLRGPEEHGMRSGVSLEVACDDPGRAPDIVAAVRQLSMEHNVFRGHVISFDDDDLFDQQGASLLSFVERPGVTREQVILRPDLLAGVEQQVLGVARHAARLRASGQHLRRGILLYGPPGTGKTHLIRYLLSRLAGTTAVLLSGSSLGMIGDACSVARSLQPSVVVIEDVDLIAEEREHYPGQTPLLFELLNQMDGLGSDADVAFLLTTNRADLLEGALAARPGRVDHAAELPVPDADARLRLLRLYQGNLHLELTSTEDVIARTEGVTASFIKELLRRAALVAAESDPGRADSADPLRVTDEHLGAALDQLLDTRNALTQVLLGGRPGALTEGS